MRKSEGMSGPGSERGNFVANFEADRVIYSKIIQEAGIRPLCRGRQGRRSLKSNLNPKFPFSRLHPPKAGVR